jgi:hypothetical protein
MSHISKSLVPITLGAALLVTAYQASRAAKLQAENQRIRQAIVAPPVIKPARAAAAGPLARAVPKLERLEESEEERLARLLEAADESIRQQKAAAELDGSNRPCPYSLVEPGGKGLTKGAAKAAGLSKDQQEAVAEVLRNTWSLVSDDFARRATFVEEESSEAAGISVFMISARPDRGKEFKEQLERELDAAVGGEKRKILMKGVERYDFPGAFGASDVRLEFSVRDGVCKFAYLNPNNGMPSRFGSRPFGEFVDLFGDSFEVPEALESIRSK